MKETRTDTQTALLQALGLHVLLFVLMFTGLQWTRSNMTEPAAGDPIEADLVDPSALSAAMRSALQRTPELATQDMEPELEALPLPQPIAESTLPVPEPEPVEQERVQLDAESPDVAKIAREQEEMRKPPAQTDLDAKQKQQQSEQELQRQQQLADIRRQREQAAKELAQAEMRAQQLADARSQVLGNSPVSPPPGNRGIDPGLLAQYTAALQQAILRQWIRPESVQMGERCRIAIRQLPGGEVIDVAISPSCPFDELGRRSVERAVLKASPLPYAGFESVFDRNVTLNFVAEER